MISIVICHRDEVLLQKLSANIAASIGVAYELVVVDNRANTHSLCSAYNAGVARAKFEIICFVHEDVLFCTEGWGKNVLTHFDDPATGMIGVTGARAQSAAPGAWWYNNYFAQGATNLLMSRRKQPGIDLDHLFNNPCPGKTRCQVTIIDGLWFCIRKSLFEKIRFDDINFNGFHLYDADISMQVREYANNFIVYDVLLQHVWKGSIDRTYYPGLRKFAEKWLMQLPASVPGLPTAYAHRLGWHSLRSYVLDLLQAGVEGSEIEDIIEAYLPQLRNNYRSAWFEWYFKLGKRAGYQAANRIFVRVEKLTGFCKTPGYTRTAYILPEETKHRLKIN